MNYRTLSVALGALLLLTASVPLTVATHQKGDPLNSPLGTVGGVILGVRSNVVEQDLDAGTKLPKTSSGSEQLITSGSYDCTTGEPAAPGPNAGKFSFDVVPLNILRQAPGLNDHILDGPGSGPENTVEDTTGMDDPLGRDFFDGGEASSFVYYGGDVELGYGATKPDYLYPGQVTFIAFVYCHAENGAVATKVVPKALPGQAAGLLGFVDEQNIDADGDGNPFDEEFTFNYRNLRTDQTGAVLPGDLRTPGWYMNYVYTWSTNYISTYTFRFVVNPVLSPEHPGYLGSRFAAPERGCLVNGEAGEDSGLFGNCAEGNPSQFYQEEATGTAPILEDIERFGTVDGEDSTIEAAAMEADAIAQAVDETTAPFVPDVSPYAPFLSANGQWGDFDFGNGWKLFFDVYPFSGIGVGGITYAGLAVDPLYGSGVTAGPNAYPPGQGYAGWLGLAKDANNDSSIDFGNPAEWWGIDDRLDVNNTYSINWGDVGLKGMEDGIFTTLPIVASDFCLNEFTPYTAGWAPIAPQDIATCNPYGNDTEGWGTFLGQTSNDLQGLTVAHGRFNSEMWADQVGGSLATTWTTKVTARVIWPPAEFISTAKLFLPSGVVLPASTVANPLVMTIVDEDVYANVVTA